MTRGTANVPIDEWKELNRDLIWLKVKVDDGKRQTELTEFGFLENYH